MNEIIDTLATLIDQHGQILWLLGLVSVVLLVGTALLIPLIIILLPADFFVRSKPPWWKLRGHVLSVAVMVAIARNLIGLVMLIAGVIMLFVPGQGLLTILLALALMDFPGKRRLTARLVQNPRVMGAVNRIRRRADKPDFRLPGSPSGCGV